MCISLISYFTLESFVIGLLNFAQGLKGEYKPIIPSSPKEFSLVTKMSNKYYHKTYWEPAIELSFFIVALFVFIYTIIPLPGIIAFAVSIFVGSNTMIALWILEDLSLNISKEGGSFLGLVKQIRLSKNTIQLASIYPIAKWFTNDLVIEPIYVPIFDFEIPFYNLMMELSLGGLILIVLISLLNLFTWCYLRLLKTKYKEKVNLISEEIAKKTLKKF